DGRPRLVEGRVDEVELVPLVDELPRLELDLLEVAGGLGLDVDGFDGVGAAAEVLVVGDVLDGRPGDGDLGVAFGPAAAGFVAAPAERFWRDFAGGCRSNGSNNAHGLGDRPSLSVGSSKPWRSGLLPRPRADPGGGSGPVPAGPFSRALSRRREPADHEPATP